jgi:putative transposase
MVPHDLPACGALYYSFRTWRKEGIWDQIQKGLLRRVRQKEGRDEEPGAAVIDSQSIKTSAVRGSEKGYDGGKKTWGRKRHALVDTNGNLMEVKVTAASDSDLEGSKKLFLRLKQLFPRLKLLWGDSHYGLSLIEWLKEHIGRDMQILHGPSIAAKPSTSSDQAKPAPSKGGFQVIPRRWVVERSFGWITRWRRLCRDHEGLPESSEAFIKLSASRRMLSHLIAASL